MIILITSSQSQAPSALCLSQVYLLGCAQVSRWRCASIDAKTQSSVNKKAIPIINFIPDSEPISPAALLPALQVRPASLSSYYSVILSLSSAPTASGSLYYMRPFPFVSFACPLSAAASGVPPLCASISSPYSGNGSWRTIVRSFSLTLGKYD